MRLLLVFCALPAMAQAASPLSGSWQCQSAEGLAKLVFLDAKQLSYNGEISPYSVQGNILWVSVGGIPAAYRFHLSGQRLEITQSEGGQIHCSRATTAKPQPDTPDKAEKDAGGNLNHLLQGTLCSWSGSSGGGSSYSSSTRVSFDGRGHFAIGSESSFSGNSGAYATQGRGNGGSYQVSAARVGAPVKLLWNSGERGVAYVNFVYGGRITELKYGKQIFGAPLCN